MIGIDESGNERTIMARIGSQANRQVESHRWAFSAVRHRATGKGRMYVDQLLELSDKDDETGIYVLNEFGLLLQKKSGRIA